MSDVLTGSPFVYFSCEGCKSTLQNPTPDVLAEWQKEHQGHAISKSVKYHLFDLGYNDLKKASELATIAQALGAMVADVRFMPHTRNPEFSHAHLVEVLGENYVHVGELGNANYRGEGDIQLVNVEAGMAVLHGLLANKSVIIICACWKRSDCHRMHVASEYERRFGVATTQIARADARALLTTVQAANDPQMSLFDA